MMRRPWIRLAQPPELTPAGEGAPALGSGVAPLAWPAQDPALRPATVAPAELLAAALSFPLRPRNGDAGI
jgi:hypothetical protein